jgi:hypothetical protein
MLLACLVVFFAVVGGSYPVGMCGQFMKLRGSPMRILRHNTSFQSMLARRPQQRSASRGIHIAVSFRPKCWIEFITDQNLQRTKTESGCA